MNSRPKSSGSGTQEPIGLCPAIERGCVAKEAASKVSADTPTCGAFASARSSTASPLETQRKPSKPWGCPSKTLTPTPEPAGYCAGDVAGKGGDCATRL